MIINMVFIYFGSVNDVIYGFYNIDDYFFFVKFRYVRNNEVKLVVVWSLYCSFNDFQFKELDS